VDREYVLTALSFAACGSAMFVVGGLLKAAPLRERPLIDLERVSWIRVVLPFLAGLCAFAALMGWWALEPDDSESVPLPVFLAAGAVGVVWLRALARAAWALRTAEPVAATVGLLRPRVILSEACKQTLSKPVSGSGSVSADAEAASASGAPSLRLFTPEAVEPSEHPVEVELPRVGSQDRGQITRKPSLDLPSPLLGQPEGLPLFRHRECAELGQLLVDKPDERGRRQVGATLAEPVEVVEVAHCLPRESCAHFLCACLGSVQREALRGSHVAGERIGEELAQADLARRPQNWPYRNLEPDALRPELGRVVELP
jgi:hypothetical protein